MEGAGASEVVLLQGGFIMGYGSIQQYIAVYNSMSQYIVVHDSSI